MKVFRNLPVLGYEMLTLLYGRTQTEIQIFHVNPLSHISPKGKKVIVSELPELFDAIVGECCKVI